METGEGEGSLLQGLMGRIPDPHPLPTPPPPLLPMPLSLYGDQMGISVKLLSLGLI